MSIPRAFEEAYYKPYRFNWVREINLFLNYNTVFFKLAKNETPPILIGNTQSGQMTHTVESKIIRALEIIRVKTNHISCCFMK